VKTITTKGQNINIAWHPSGIYIAVGNKVNFSLFMTFDVKDNIHILKRKM
jgi:hypothetical protein